MGSSRKRQKELKRLKGSATDVWGEQREVLDHASEVLTEARRQLGKYAREDVVPRVRDTYDGRLKPAIVGGVAATKAASYTARARIADEVIPAATGAIGSTLAALSAINDPRVREAAKLASKKTLALSKKAQKKVAPPSSDGPGKYILLALGVVAALGVGYAAWQTLRADDDLWIEDLSESEVTPEA